MGKKTAWETVRPYLMIAPAMLGIVTFVIYPIAYLIYLSFYKYNLMNKSKSKFIGLENFEQIFTRGDFYKALGNTVTYTVGVVVLTLVISLLMAIWLNKKYASMRLCKQAYLPRISYRLFRYRSFGCG